jgi:hypothetical protein
VQEIISGVIVIVANCDVRHDGITLVAEGSVNLQLSSKNVGIFEAFYNSVKVRTIKIGSELYLQCYDVFQPVSLVSCLLEVSSAGKIPSGKTEIPFEFPLRARSSKPLYETYHGVFVSIQYTLKCEIKRSFLAKDLVKTAEFFVEYNVSSHKPTTHCTDISFIFVTHS